jgi:hypothetical protein
MKMLKTKIRGLPVSTRDSYIRKCDPLQLSYFEATAAKQNFDHEELGAG